jgi:hypothetical protein
MPQQEEEPPTMLCTCDGVWPYSVLERRKMGVFIAMSRSKRSAHSYGYVCLQRHAPHQGLSS